MAETRGPRRAAGVVVVRRLDDEGWRVLVLRAYRNWDFPKGVAEPGEAPQATAVREAEEEAGLRDLAFRWGDGFVETEPYAGGKVARFYVAESPGDTVVLRPNPALGRAEHHEWRWATFAEARRLLAPRLQRVLAWAASVVGVRDLNARC
ncbi:MAG: NUDIX domain-containing protein [bacterium]|nr:NUDIX domain-containing protein [bacterium]